MISPRFRRGGGGGFPEGVFCLEDGVADELAGVLVFQPVENARSACLVVTMRPRRIFARCWTLPPETYGPSPPAG